MILVMGHSCAFGNSKGWCMSSHNLHQVQDFSYIVVIRLVLVAILTGLV
jgi:hypothetical protein